MVFQRSKVQSVCMCVCVGGGREGVGGIGVCLCVLYAYAYVYMIFGIAVVYLCMPEYSSPSRADSMYALQNCTYVYIHAYNTCGPNMF